MGIPPSTLKNYESMVYYPVPKWVYCIMTIRKSTDIENEHFTISDVFNNHSFIGDFGFISEFLWSSPFSTFLPFRKNYNPEKELY